MKNTSGDYVRQLRCSLMLAPFHYGRLKDSPGDTAEQKRVRFKKGYNDMVVSLAIMVADRDLP